MNKCICVALIALASQAHGYQATDNSTFVYADLLVWKLREGAADNWADVITDPGPKQYVTQYGVPFNWSPGVRLGIGRNNAHWDTTFSYTGFETKATSNAYAPTGGVYSPFLGNFYINNTNGVNFGPHYRSASVFWKVTYNILDLELGRKFKIDEYLQLRPFLGIKGGWINQKINTSWYSPTTPTTFSAATENIKHDFSGVGPSIGMDSTWTMFRGSKSSLNLIGNFSAALMWAHWVITDTYHNNTPTTVTLNEDTITGAATMARGLLGIEWTSCYARVDVKIRLGYEAQVWFNQVQFYSFSMGRLNNIMSLQGGVLGFSFNF